MRYLKKILGHKPQPEPPGLSYTAIIVTGMGRCGTTLVETAFKNYGFRGATFLPTFRDCFIYGNGKVYKTHFLPPDRLPYNVKLMYMIGNPFDIVISTNNQINNWGKLHHLHLGSDLFTENNEIFIKDTLQLHRHFDLWYRQQKFTFLSIKYEALYLQKTREILNEYMGFELLLPSYIKRQSNWVSHPRKDELIKLYGRLYEKIMEAEDIKIWKPI